MDEDLYDEFGNYIGPEQPEPGSFEEGGLSIEHVFDEDQPETAPMEDGPYQQYAMHPVTMEATRQLNQLALYEQPYDKSVETLVQEEDTQPLSAPIIAPLKQKLLRIESEGLPYTSYEKQFLGDLLTSAPDRTRSFAIAGHLGAGKSSLVDLLMESTHPHELARLGKLEREGRSILYSDTLALERARGMSIQPTALTLLEASSKSTSFALQMIDCPGHLEFSDQLVAAVALVDGIVLVVDALEGVMPGTDLTLKLAARENLPVVVVINKLSRLIVELKLPPVDAYFKLKHTMDQLNTVMRGCGGSTVFSPERGNVCFADTQSGWIFSLQSFANIYAEQNQNLDAAALAVRLWGDIYYNASDRSFSTSSRVNTRRSFVEWILEPLYKIYGQVIGEETETLQSTLSSLGILLKDSEYKLNTKPLLRLIMGRLFGHKRGIPSFVDMVSNCLPDPVRSARNKIERAYTGPLDSDEAKSMLKGRSEGAPFIAYVSKLFPCNAYMDVSNPTAEIRFEALTRIYSGVVSKGDKIAVLGEMYSKQDPEDSSYQTVSEIYLPVGRYGIPVDRAVAGMLVLLRGIDATLSKTATLTNAEIPENVAIFSALQLLSHPVVKLAIEPYKPSELPKLLDGLRMLTKTYPQLKTHVEASGEHCLLGTGELSLDSMLYDLRHYYAAELDLRVADPVVTFNETIVEMSELPCFATSPNGKNTLTMIAQPLDKPIADDLEAGILPRMTPKERAEYLVQKYEKYDWDLLSARNIWAFGPDRPAAGLHGTCILGNDTLSFETDKKLLAAAQDSIVQGFYWAAREGPLCDEPIRNVRFRLTKATLAAEPIYRGGGQIIPTARRVVYSSVLTGAPRLMEPVYAVYVQAPADCLPAVYNVFARRRGHILQDAPKDGTPFYSLKGLLPVMDSFGFETDLRTHTLGQAFSQSIVDHWQIVPGDPLDASISLVPLEPSPPPHLARDFLLKTRRRKGLPDDPSIHKFLDDAMRLALESHENQIRDI